MCCTSTSIFSTIPCFAGWRTKLTTLHGRQDLPEMPDIYRAFPHMPLVSISGHQRKPVPPVNWRGTVYHGLPQGMLTEGAARALSGFPGPHFAPTRAFCRQSKSPGAAGLPLKVAAKVDPADQNYFQQQVRPVLASSPHGGIHWRDRGWPEIRISGTQSAAVSHLLAGTLRPGDDRSMALRTPVIAFDSGSVPEIMETASPDLWCAMSRVRWRRSANSTGCFGPPYARASRNAQCPCHGAGICTDLPGAGQYGRSRGCGGGVI